MNRPPEKLRAVRLRPYVKGPQFTLTVWDTFRADSDGKRILRYELRQSGIKDPIFAAEDFACSAYTPIDSDACMAAILGFLTLVPGDVEASYFANYTPEQLAFRDAHAEELMGEVSSRFIGEVK